uniref:ZW10 C-terminal helical domain-containing protein n=1 Tax=Wuchereria bancrofti TaxID=6293 RepID=A0A1I8EW82_WUCBA
MRYSLIALMTTFHSYINERIDKIGSMRPVYSTQNIYDRLCDGKKFLALWLHADEVRHLVEALFQNIKRRAHVLSEIN